MAPRPGLGQARANTPPAFKKGSHICVEGELRSREYESNGAKVRTYDIVANSIINIRAGQRYTAQTSDPTEAAAWAALRSSGKSAVPPASGVDRTGSAF
jgi:single-stranded DNA-binding protein